MSVLLQKRTRHLVDWMSTKSKQLPATIANLFLSAFLPPTTPSATPLACRPGVVLTPFHAFELQSIRIEEEHGVVVVVILGRWVNNGRAQLLYEGLQRVDVLVAAQLECVVNVRNN